MTREEFQKTVSERFTNTDSGFGNMTQRERILLQIASNVYDGVVKNCSIQARQMRLEQKPIHVPSEDEHGALENRIDSESKFICTAFAGSCSVQCVICRDMENKWNKLKKES